MGRIVCVSVLSGSWVLGRMALVYPFHVPSRTFLPYGSLLPSSSLPPSLPLSSLSSLCLCVSSFSQGGSPPSQVTPEQIPQRRVIPTNTPTTRLWSVTSLLSLRGQSSIMWRMIPRLRAVGTQVGTDAVGPVCSCIEGVQEKETGASQKYLSCKGRKAQNMGN